MGPMTHAFASWWVANARPLSRRDRTLVVLAGLVPDLDGLTLLVGQHAYVTYHHVVCHNALAALVCVGLAALFARERAACAALAFVAFHLHLACDYFGSGGTDGSVWVLPYLYPLVGGYADAGFAGPPWYWNRWQWPLSSWQNLVCTLAGLAAWVYVAVRLDRTWFEAVWPAMDKELCRVLRGWFGGRPSPEWTPREARWIRRALLAGCVAVFWASLLAGYGSRGTGAAATPAPPIAESAGRRAVP